MQKHTIKYDSPLDALIVLAKRLNNFEKIHGLISEDFFDKFNKGLLDDTIDFVEWSNDYQHFIALKIRLEERLTHVA